MCDSWNNRAIHPWLFLGNLWATTGETGGMYMSKLISFQYSLCLRGKIKKKEVIVVPTVFKYFFRCCQCRLSSMTFLQCIPMFPFSWSSVDIKCQRKKSWSPAINITLGYEINSNRVSGNFASNDNICE